MAKPYSEDLRRRVVGTIEGGTTIPEAAEQCGVSISSVVRFLKLHRETGGVESASLSLTTWPSSTAKLPCSADTTKVLMSAFVIW